LPFTVNFSVGLAYIVDCNREQRTVNR